MDSASLELAFDAMPYGGLVRSYSADLATHLVVGAMDQPCLFQVMRHALRLPSDAGAVDGGRERA